MAKNVIGREQETGRSLKETVRLQSGQRKRSLDCNPGKENANPTMPSRWPLKRQPDQMSEQGNTADKRVPREPKKPMPTGWGGKSVATKTIANKNRQAITYDVQIHCLEQPLLMFMQNVLERFDP